MENLNIPSKYRRTGLYVYCNKCKRYSKISEGCLSRSPNCVHPTEKQVFKLKVYIPNTRNFSRTKILNTRDIKDADSQRIEFIKLLKENNYNLNSQNTISESEHDRYNLLYQMSRFIEFISKGGFYGFESPKKLSLGTINDYKRNFKYFLDSQTESYNIKTLSVDDIKEPQIELFHNSLIKRSNSLKTYNNIMSQLRSFYNHLNKYEKIKIDNPFDLVPNLMVSYNPLTINEDEYIKLMSATTLENGYDAKTKKNRYREWLPTAFKLGLYSCLRLDELAHLKYCDIVETKEVTVIEIDNYKVNRIKGVTQEKDKRIKRVPLIEQMLTVLNEECDFQNNKGKDEFILAPSLLRSTVNGIIGKGFTHFKRVAGIDNKKCFKDLRKTFINKMHYGDIEGTCIVSDHSTPEVVNKHYLAQLEGAKKNKNLKIFSENI